MIRWPHVAGRLIECEARGDRLSAILRIGSADEDVVDPARRLVRAQRVRVAAIERVAGPAIACAPAVGEVHRLALERGEAVQETDLVGVWPRIEVAHQDWR